MGLRAVRRHLVWHCALHRPQRGITEVSASDETRVAVRSARRRSAVFWSTEMMPTIAQMSLARAIVIVTYSDEMLGCRGRGLSVAMVGCHRGTISQRSPSRRISARANRRVPISDQSAEPKRAHPKRLSSRYLVHNKRRHERSESYSRWCCGPRLPTVQEIGEVVRACASRIRPSDQSMCKIAHIAYAL